MQDCIHPYSIYVSILRFVLNNTPNSNLPVKGWSIDFALGFLTSDPPYVFQY